MIGAADHKEFPLALNGPTIASNKHRVAIGPAADVSTDFRSTCCFKQGMLRLKGALAGLEEKLRTSITALARSGAKATRHARRRRRAPMGA